MIRFVLSFFLLFSLVESHAQANKLSVGDIGHDAKTDDPKFKFCNNKFVLQGYELKTRSDETRHWISQQLKQKFVSRKEWSDQTGFITVRFVVNCLGLTDRFRAMGVTAELHSSDFEESLNQYLISLTKEMKEKILRTSCGFPNSFHLTGRRLYQWHKIKMPGWMKSMFQKQLMTLIL